MTENPESLAFLRDVERRAWDALQLSVVNATRAAAIHEQMFAEWQEAKHAVQAAEVDHSPENTATLTGDCEIDCQERCAYPGQFSECSMSGENRQIPLPGDTIGWRVQP